MLQVFPCLLFGKELFQVFRSWRSGEGAAFGSQRYANVNLGKADLLAGALGFIGFRVQGLGFRVEG